MEVYFWQATELLPNEYVVCRMVMFSLMSVRGEGGLQMTTTHDLFKLVHLLHPDLFKLACLRTPPTANPLTSTPGPVSKWADGLRLKCLLVPFVSLQYIISAEYFVICIIQNNFVLLGNLVFFPNEEIFVLLDELDELDRITQDSITASQKHRKHSSVVVRVTDSKASNLGSILGQVSEFF